MKTHNRVWFLVIVLGWTGLLLFAAFAAHHGGWHHVWHHLAGSTLK